MRWKVKTWQGPRIGDRKESKRFALLPTEIDGEWVWFEYYWEVKVWTELGCYAGSDIGFIDGWVVETRIKL